MVLLYLVNGFFNEEGEIILEKITERNEITYEIENTSNLEDLEDLEDQEIRVEKKKILP